MSFTGPLVAGRWRLGPRLGRGSQAETYLARDEQPGRGPREVVVKRMALRGAWKQFELFERETKVLGQLRHPGVPRFVASVEEPAGTFNLVMERMPGDNLRELVARRRPSTVELRDILIRVLEILDHLHSRSPPVVHRDIKPSNIVRAPDGKIALVDFGGVLDGAREQGGSTIVGTFGYMAPEQLHGQAIPATDLYALGATIVALAGGIEPEDVPRKGLRMDLARHLPAMDPALRSVLEAMTDPEPDRRPQRARDVIKLLARAAPPEPAAAIALRPPVAPTRRRRRRMFATAPEPVGTLLRLLVLSFAVTGWAGMAVARVAVVMATWILATVARPRRLQIRDAGGELAAMLAEGQGGFGDLARATIGAPRRPQLPPPEG